MDATLYLAFFAATAVMILRLGPSVISKPLFPKRLLVVALTSLFLSSSSLAGHYCTEASQWPFGNGERRVKGGAKPHERVVFLRRAVKDGFPIPEDMRTKLAKDPNEPVLYQLQTANALVNGIPYAKDLGDEWKTPRKFLAEGGDCEDYSLAKYVLLRKLGYSAEAMRVTLVRVRGKPNRHAILVVKASKGRYHLFVLDNLHSYLRTSLYCSEYFPLISFNERGMWLHTAKAPPSVPPKPISCS